MAAVEVSGMLSNFCGLVLRPLLHVHATPDGSRPEGVVSLRTLLPLPKYNQTSLRMAFYDRVLADVHALPGVKSAAYISFLPMAMGGGIFPVTVEGRTVTPNQRAHA